MKNKISAIISVVCLVVAALLLIGLTLSVENLDFSEMFDTFAAEPQVTLPAGTKVLSGTWTWNENPSFTQDYILEDISYTIGGQTETYDRLVINYVDSMSYDGNYVYVDYSKTSLSTRAFVPECTQLEDWGWQDENYRSITFKKNVIVSEKFYNEFILAAKQEVIE